MNNKLEEKPNVIFIYTDDLGYGSLSCYGADKIDTPNIDRLTQEGIRFDQAYVPTSVCTPSRYALITGEYSWRTPHGPNVVANDPLMIDTNKLTLADVFKKAGYTTGGFGKWHLGLGDEEETDYTKPLRPGPNDLGFDYYFGLPVGHFFPPYVYFENDHVVNNDPDDPIHIEYGDGFPEQKGGKKARYNKEKIRLNSPIKFVIL